MALRASKRKRKFTGSAEHVAAKSAAVVVECASDPGPDVEIAGLPAETAAVVEKSASDPGPDVEVAGLPAKIADILQDCDIVDPNSYDLQTIKAFCYIKPKIVGCNLFKNAVDKAIPAFDEADFGSISWEYLKPFVNLTGMDDRKARKISIIISEGADVSEILGNAKMSKELFAGIVCYYWRIMICNALVENLCDCDPPPSLNAKHFDAAAIILDIVDKNSIAIVDTLSEVVSTSGVKLPMREKKRPLELGPVKEAFGVEYVDNDNIVDNFRTILAHYASRWSKDTYLAPYVSMVQASMVGKSRLMQQLSLRCFVVPLVFREEGSTGFPFATDSVLVTQLAPSTAITPLVAQVNWSLYLVYVLDSIAKFLERCTKMTAFSNKDEVFGAWTHEFDKVVVTNAAKYLSAHTKSFNEKTAKVHFVERLKKSLECVSNAAAAFFGRNSRRTLVVFVMDEARALLKPQKLVGADTVSGFRVFRRALRNLPNFDATKKASVFSVVLDTISKVANFSPTDHNDPSLRDANRLLKLYPPYCDLPTIDVLADKDHPTLKDLQKLGQYCDPNVKPVVGQFLPEDDQPVVEQFRPDDVQPVVEQLRPDDVQPVVGQFQPDAVARSLFHLGRPHWGAYLKVNPDPDLTKLLFIARHKLLNEHPDKAAQKEWSVEMSLAVLDCRLGMHIASRSHVASALVSNHMALCAKISEDRMMVKCQYPSEPILAIAAASLWNLETGTRTSVLENIFRVFVDAYSSDLIDTGNRGELMTKILLSLAWDQCFLEGRTDNDKDEETEDNKVEQFVVDEDVVANVTEWKSLKRLKCLPFGTPVRVELFLRKFVGFDVTQPPFSSEYIYWCAGGDQEKSRRLFLDGHVFFTHFIRAEWLVKFEDFGLFFRRSAAIMCKNNHKGIDFIVPVLLTDQRMSAILIQTKNIKGFDRDLANGRFTASATQSGLINDMNVPYMTLYQQLGAKNAHVAQLATEKKVGKEKEKASVTDPAVPPLSENSAPLGQAAAAGAPLATPAAEGDGPIQAAYQLCGFDSSVYPFLEKLPGQVYKLLKQFFYDEKLDVLQKYNDHCTWREFPLTRKPKEAEKIKITPAALNRIKE